MSINFLSVNPVLNNHKTESFATNCATRLHLRPQLTKDTVSFGQTKDLLQQPKEKITEKILSSLKNEQNLIGEGTTATVYKIEDTNYCVKIPKSIPANDSTTIEKILKTLTFDISEQDKVNHIIAKSNEKNSSTNTITIMKLLEGETIKELKSYREIVSQMKQEAYNKLYSQLCNAKKQNMHPDIYYENMIIDRKNNTMTAIDFYEEQSIQHVLKTLHEMLTCNFYSEHAAPRKIDAMCGKKLLLAALNDFEHPNKLQQNLNEYQFEKYIKMLEYYDAIDTVDAEKLKEKFKELINLKTSELQGNNVRKKIENHIDTITILIDTYLKDY